MIDLQVLERCLAVLAKRGIEKNPKSAFTIEEIKNGQARFACRTASNDIATLIISLFEALDRHWTSPCHARDTRDQAKKEMTDASRALKETMAFAREILTTPLIPRSQSEAPTPTA